MKCLHARILNGALCLWNTLVKNKRTSAILAHGDIFSIKSVFQKFSIRYSDPILSRIELALTNTRGVL
jgi:hypothetical protein